MGKMEKKYNQELNNKIIYKSSQRIKQKPHLLLI